MASANQKRSQVEEQDYGDLFEEQVKQALNHFQDAAWLGHNSPLAHPYFLGNFFAQQPELSDTAVLQGQTLQDLFFETAVQQLEQPLLDDREQFVALVHEERAELGIKSSAYQLLLLDLKYFRRIFPPIAYPQAKNEYDIRDFLGLGRSTLFNHLKVARQQLGQSLLKQLSPTLRLEQPPHPHGRIVGQDEYLETAVFALSQNQTLFLNGVGGLGKTTLGATIARRWPQTRRFWYTFWPSLNDQIDTLLFSLGHFLNQQGASHLWRQLVVNGGQIENLNIAIAQLRTDLATLEEKPLLCFDEVDHLSGNPDTQSESDLQIITFLERIARLTPILLIGQQANLVADQYLTLEALTLEQTEELALAQHLTLPRKRLQHLHAFTNGNPRLIKLSLPMMHEGQLDSSALPKTASISGLFATLWRTLSPEARALAQQLAVFRSPTPADAWAEMETELTLLHHYALLQKDEQGSVQLLPIFRELIQTDSNRLSADTSERCHLTAAAIRSERGELTASVYHLLKAGEVEPAVQLWFIHRQHEIARGQARIALSLLQTVPRRRLGAEAKHAHAVAIAELCDLLGKPSEGLAALNQTAWQKTKWQTIDVESLRGRFHNALGRREQAIQAIDRALENMATLIPKQVQFFSWRGGIHLEQRDLGSALNSARRAQYEATLFYGWVQEEMGRYDEALVAYQQAVAHATLITFDEGIARANNNLARLLTRQGKLPEALAKAEQAIDYFEQRGEMFSVEKLRNTIIGIHFNLGQFEQVIELGEKSLTFFQNAAMPYWASTTAATLAEAYLELGQMGMAKQRAHEVLSYEEPLSVPYAHFTLGLVAKREGNLEQAKQHFTQAQGLTEEKSDHFLLAYVERALGELLIELDEKNSASEHLRRSLTLFQQLKNKPEVQATEALLLQTTDSR